MFNGFIDLTNSLQNDWGEQLLKAVVSQRIGDLFTYSQSVEVSIESDPASQLLQGEIDRLIMKGQGLIIHRDFSVEELSFATDRVLLDFESVLKGKIHLKQPTHAIAQVIISEADINRAFQTELVQKHIQQLIHGQPISFGAIQVQILPENRLHFFAKADVPNYGQLPICLSGNVIVDRPYRLALINPQFLTNLVPESLTKMVQKLNTIFTESLNNLVRVDNLAVDGVKLLLNHVETEAEKLIFSGDAEITHFPQSG